MKILVLDDDNNRLQIFKNNLENKLKSFDNDYATNAKQAINYLQNNEYSYVFLDHDLDQQQMSWNEDNCGMTVVDWILNNNYNKHSSFIVHSWNIRRGQEMVDKLKNGGYTVIHQPGIWNNIGL